MVSAARHKAAYMGFAGMSMAPAMPQSAWIVRCLQLGEQEGQGIGAYCDGKPRQRNSSDFSLHPGRVGQPFSRRLPELHDEPDRGQRLMRHPADAEPAYFDQPGQGLGRTDQQPSVSCLDMNAVVGDEPGERDHALRGGVQQRQREPGFARA